MKKIVYIFTIISIFTLLGCKHTNYQSYALKLDCTGYYFNIGGKDYQICNDKVVANFKDGQVINAVVNRIDACARPSDLMCAQYHPYEGYIYIEKIK